MKPRFVTFHHFTEKSFSSLKVLYGSKTLETAILFGWSHNKHNLCNLCKIPSGGAQIGSVTLAGALGLITFGTPGQMVTDVI